MLDLTKLKPGFSVPNSRCYTDRLTVLYQVPTAVLSFSLAAGSKFAPSFRVTSSSGEPHSKAPAATLSPHPPSSYTSPHCLVYNLRHPFPPLHQTFLLPRHIHLFQQYPSSWKRSFIRNSVYLRLLAPQPFADTHSCPLHERWPPPRWTTKPTAAMTVCRRCNSLTRLDLSIRATST